ncbi:MAG: hypothetical protein ABI672_08455 [Vicinamibacteria bacterium]
MRVVRFATNEVKSPGKCACCLGDETEAIEIIKKTAGNVAAAVVMKAASGSSIAANGLQNRARTSVPYCEACAAHARWNTTGGWSGIVMHGLGDLLIGGLIVAMIGGTLLPSLSGKGWAQLLALGLLILAVGALSWLRSLDRPSGPLGRNHATPGHSIEIASWSGSSIELKCHNDKFAEALQTANPGSALLPLARSASPRVTR